MGRPPLPERAPRLSPRQREMLRAVVEHGAAFRFLKTSARSAWRIRFGAPGRASPVVTFSYATGWRLVELGYIERDFDGDVRTQNEVIAHRYVATVAGSARVRK